MNASTRRERVTSRADQPRRRVAGQIAFFPSQPGHASAPRCRPAQTFGQQLPHGSQRPRPSASRTAISFRLASARANNRLATFPQAMRRNGSTSITRIVRSCVLPAQFCQSLATVDRLNSRKVGRPLPCLRTWWSRCPTFLGAVGRPPPVSRQRLRRKRGLQTAHDPQTPEPTVAEQREGRAQTGSMARGIDSRRSPTSRVPQRDAE